MIRRISGAIFFLLFINIATSAQTTTPSNQEQPPVVDTPESAQPPLENYQEILKQFPLEQVFETNTTSKGLLIHYPNQHSINYGRLIIAAPSNATTSSISQFILQLNQLGWHVYLLLHQSDSLNDDVAWLNDLDVSINHIEQQASDEIFLLLLQQTSFDWIKVHNLKEESGNTKLLAKVTPKLSGVLIYLTGLPSQQIQSFKNFNKVGISPNYLIITSASFREQVTPAVEMIAKQQNSQVDDQLGLDLHTSINNQVFITKKFHGWMKKITLKSSK